MNMDSEEDHRFPPPPPEPEPERVRKVKRKAKRSAHPTVHHATTREQVSQLAMLASITSGTFEDVKFYTFSRRTRAGNVDRPLPLYGNSALIRKASRHFDGVLMQGFSESGVVDMNALFPSSRSSSIDADDYGYASDSDLNDEPEDPHVDLAPSLTKLSLDVPVVPEGHQTENSTAEVPFMPSMTIVTPVKHKVDRREAAISQTKERCQIEAYQDLRSSDLRDLAVSSSWTTLPTARSHLSLYLRVNSCV